MDTRGYRDFPDPEIVPLLRFGDQCENNSHLVFTIMWLCVVVEVAQISLQNNGGPCPQSQLLLAIMYDLLVGQALVQS